MRQARLCGPDVAMLAQFIDRQAQGSHMKMGSNGATLVAVTEKNVPVEATGKIKKRVDAPCKQPGSRFTKSLL